ncbi:hypothetical protein, partial [Actinomadura logoneensis]|uniref:hypothetical protein n=1 Tax=Actinomadura logoneensis TaxID=2293572 RepID=UPI0018F22BF6
MWGRVGLGVPLAVAAVAQFTGKGTDANALLYGLLLCLFTTLPLVIPHIGLAAVAVAGACLTSLTASGSLTAGGCAALLIALYLLGRAGTHVLAAVLIAPFAVLALLPHPGLATRAAAVLAPVAAGAGAVR